MIKRILKALTDHADGISSLFVEQQVIPVSLVCKYCTAPITIKNMLSHKCVTRKLVDQGIYNDFK